MTVRRQPSLRTASAVPCRPAILGSPIQAVALQKQRLWRRQGYQRRPKASKRNHHATGVAYVVIAAADQRRLERNARRQMSPVRNRRARSSAILWEPQNAGSVTATSRWISRVQPSGLRFLRQARSAAETLSAMARKSHALGPGSRPARSRSRGIAAATRPTPSSWGRRSSEKATPSLGSSGPGFGRHITLMAEMTRKCGTFLG